MKVSDMYVSTWHEQELKMGGLFGVLDSLSFFSHKGCVSQMNPSACVSIISNTGTLTWP